MVKRGKTFQRPRDAGWGTSAVKKQSAHQVVQFHIPSIGVLRHGDFFYIALYKSMPKSDTDFPLEILRLVKLHRSRFHKFWNFLSEDEGARRAFTKAYTYLAQVNLSRKPDDEEAQAWLIAETERGLAESEKTKAPEVPF